MVGFYQVTEKLYSLFEEQGFKSITLDEEQELDLKRQSIYPLAHIVPIQGSFVNNQSDVMSFLLIVLDLTDFNKNDPRKQDLMFYGIDNRQDIMHSLREKLRRVIMDFVKGDAYSELMQATLPVGVDPIILEFENVLTGWSAVLNITIPSNTDICE